MAAVSIASALLLALTASSPPALAAPFCTDNTPPAIDAAFSDLQSAVDVAVGKPRECAHFVLAGEILLQHLDTGALLLNASTGDATFTNGSEFWTMTSDGTVNQTSTPPYLIVPALLADVTPPDRTSIEVAGVAVQSTTVPTVEASLSATPVATATAAKPPMYYADPRLVALQLTDLPNGAHSWVRISEDTSRLLQYQYTVQFGKHPDNGVLTPLDPVMIINVLMADSLEHAQDAWDQMYGRPGAGQRAGGDLAPFTDAQFYALAPNVIDVRARDRNVILQAVEMTTGRESISLDDTVSAVRIMASRVDQLIR